MQQQSAKWKSVLRFSFVSPGAASVRGFAFVKRSIQRISPLRAAHRVSGLSRETRKRRSKMSHMSGARSRRRYKGSLRPLRNVNTAGIDADKKQRDGSTAAVPLSVSLMRVAESARRPACALCVLDLAALHPSDPSAAVRSRADGVTCAVSRGAYI